ncbi:MAG: SAM-dependent methyltransferase [Treponema sp.]|nr:SAM-dependent methyltransferase [Treponema sp.]
MSEELLQTIPQQIGKFTYFKLGNSTINQLVKAGILKRKDYNGFGNKKPDGLMLYQKEVVAFVEYKQPHELNSNKLILNAIAQEINIAKLICKIFIVTDGTKTFWVNALNGDKICNDAGEEIRTVFSNTQVSNIDTIEFLIDQINQSISIKNSRIKRAEFINPTSLANRLWQTIWAATGKTPIKCLYNVVELFIFKFLSDLKVLGSDYCFEKVFNKSKIDASDALDYYAKNSRRKIRRLFREGADGTTIINGTIFVDEAGNANLSQSLLFARSLKHLNDYSEEVGSLTNIDKQFKTKLYESFLKQEVEAMGQYFTPRKLVQSIIRMAQLNDNTFKFQNKRICDPFCGVGGFLLELLNLNDSMRKEYIPDKNGDISPSFIFHGFDKGFEREDERTIILAKANMLIYLSEILFRYPTCTLSFSNIFNSTFKLFKDNLGTFGHIIENEDEKYDYILSNPPYVTRGSGIIKEEIRVTPHTKDKYPVNALGLEGLALEWIVNSLKKGGRAFIVIPDGLLSRIQGKKLRDHILQNCILEALISLPVRTFFTNSVHAYILVLMKKQHPDEVQTDPVFTYLASDIGEKLTSIRREDIPETDLPEMETLFKFFCASKLDFNERFVSKYPRCKIQPVILFKDSSHWVIDRWWSIDEKIALGIEESKKTITLDEFEEELTGLKAVLDDYLHVISKIKD